MNIDNKIRADLFRNRIEDKNQLTGAGAIYVGTGIPKYIISTGEIIGAPLTGTIGPFYETVGVTPTTGGQIPVSVMGTGSAEATGTVAGLAFKSVNDAMKGENGSILLAANGMTVRSSNGITFLNEDAVNTDISITNKMRDISVNAAQNVSIEGETKTKISNISLDTNLKGPVTGSLYTAPSGSASLDVNGVTGIYSSGTEETNLAPIIYNIGQRLDSLGFKEEVVEDGSGNNLLTFRKIGYYVLVTLEQSISVVWEADDFYCNVPQAFQKQKKETKTLFSIDLNSDRLLDTVVSISYRIDDSEHTIEFKNQDAIYNLSIDACFNKGIIFGYDIRE